MEDVYDDYATNDDDSNPYRVQLSPASWRVLGHGTYEEVVSEDIGASFIELAKQHEKLVVHFCRQDEPECEIMHNHLGQIAKQHFETKFVHLNVEDTSRSPEDMLVIESKLGIQTVPTLIFVKKQQYAYRLEGFHELGGRDTSTFALKDFLARHGVLNLTEAEVARKMLEAEAIQLRERRVRSGVANSSFPSGFAAGAVTQEIPVGWGPIPSFDFGAVGGQDKTTAAAQYPGDRYSTTQHPWGPTASYDESTNSYMRRNPPFDSRKLPAAAFAALGALVGAGLAICSNGIGAIVGTTATTCSSAFPRKEASVDESQSEVKEIPTSFFGNERTLRLKVASMIAATTSFLSSLPFWVIPTGVASSLVLALVLLKLGITPFTYQKTIQVAFIGNAVQYFNDFPRFMEVISGDHVIQNSCLHEDATLLNLLQSGNGMLKKFNTDKARIGGGSSNLFDYGACTVHQLLFGYDGFLYGDWKSYSLSSTGSSYTGAYNDGLNPCYADADYLSYVSKQFLSNPMKWDYVVMNDDLQSPGLSESRQKSLGILMSTYAGWFAQTGSIPVFLDTPAYWTAFQNMSSFVNVPTFTSMTYEGYREYAGLLGSLLPAAQKPLIAPVGIAFLAVWEDDYEMWTKLFHYDEVNVSPHGTFLQGCVVHHTLFGHLPRADIALPDSMSSLFSRARRLQPPSHRRREWPTRDEGQYLYNIAKKVVRGYLPTTFVKFKTR